VVLRFKDDAALKRALGAGASKVAIAKDETVRRRRMNKLEQAYAQDVLEPLRLAGEIRDWKFEAIRLRIFEGSQDVKPCAYKPDFLITRPDRSMEFHEVKGRRHDGGIVRLKACADVYEGFRFALCERDRCGAWRTSWLS